MWISCARGVSDIRGQDSYLFRMLPPPPIRGLFRTDHRARAAYAEGAGIFRILPAAVCVPRDREDLASLAHWASAHRVALVPRGAGSAMGGGNVGDGVVVDLTALPRRLEVDGPARRARASAERHAGGARTSRPTARGSACRPTRRAAAGPRSAACSPPMPPARARVRYGSVRRWVEAAELVTADGEIDRASARPARAAAHARRRAVRGRGRARASARPPSWSARGSPGPGRTPSGYALDAWLASGDLLDLVDRGRGHARAS